MNVVAIVGRPNVGKSTLFNRITGKKNSIVESIPGVTRDRVMDEADWNGTYFTLIDTGGFIPGSADVMESAIREQAEIAITESDVVIFVCDGRDGVTAFDDDIARMLRNSGKPTTLVINKCDNAISDANSFEFHKLGLGEPYPISALGGRNTGDFLDEVVERLEETEKSAPDDRLKIALVGRPNVGKSSISNALTGQNRSIVTDIPGTTRDAIDSVVKREGEEIVLIDTAGLRKRKQVKENVELYSTIRTARAIDRCDVAAVVIDASQGLEDQDKKIVNQAEEKRKGILFVLNKWDLIEKDEKTADKFISDIREALPSYSYVPIVFVSALTKQRLVKILDVSKDIKKVRLTEISTSHLNRNLLPLLEKTPPPAVGGKDLRINFISQIKTEPPGFQFFCNHPHLIPSSYKRFIERKLRELYDFSGTPVSFIFRRKNKSWEDR